MGEVVLTMVSQKTKQTFTEIVNGDDVEANEKGEVDLHGITLMA
jgi:hypothetical protein